MQTIQISISDTAENTAFRIVGGETLAILRREAEETFCIDTILTDNNGETINSHGLFYTPNSFSYAIECVKILIHDRLDKYGLNVEFINL